MKTARIHVGHWGTDVTTTNATAASALVSAQITIDNDGEDAEVSVESEVVPLDARSRVLGLRP